MNSGTAATLLLAAGVAALVSAVTVRLAADRVPGIATVRLGELATGYAARAAREPGAADAADWAAALERALREAAAGHRVVLLPVRAVAAGAPDLTGEIAARLDVLLRPETKR